MAYELKISEQRPGLVVPVLDDSGSMEEVLRGTNDAKCAWVNALFGFILKHLLSLSMDMRGDQMLIKPRYFFHIIRYGCRPEVWGDPEMDIGTTVEKFTAANNSLGLDGGAGGTDTKAALEMAYDYLVKAVKDEKFKDSFPPLVFVLSDGESQTDATKIAQKIRNLQTSDGNVLLANAYIGTQTNLNYSGPEDFTGYTDVSEVGNRKDNIRMFNMSSEMPACIHQNLIEEGIFPNLRPNARLFFDIRCKDMLAKVIQVVSSIGSKVDQDLR